jgi:hypothetical protein
MKTNLRLILTLTVLVFLTVGVTTVSAQESDSYEEEDGRFVRIFFEGEVWIPQATGNEWNPTYEFNSLTGFRTVLNPGNGTQQEFRSRLGLKLAKNLGSLIFTHYTNNDDVAMSKTSPGNFIFGEILAPSLFAGYANDGLADAFEMTGSTRMSDVRFDFYRTAFENKRVSADWFVGVRRTKHAKEMNVAYYGLLPDFTQIIPSSLDPRVDYVATSSSYEGRGLEAGMDFHIPMINNRFNIDTGFAIGSLRGDVHSQYSSMTHFYYQDGVEGEGEGILVFPYDEVFEGTYTDPNGEQPLIGLVSQRDSLFAMENGGQSRNSQFLETYLRLRYRIYKTIHAFIGFRSVRYDDVYQELRPVSATTFAGVNVEGMIQVNQSAHYEGYFAGLNYTF